MISDVRKELMGHSSGGDVHSIYTHVEIPVLREAIHRLNQWYAEKISALANQGDNTIGSSTLHRTEENQTALEEHTDDGNEHTTPAA